MTNPLKLPFGTSGSSARPEAYVRINDVMVACSWDEFVGWMNAKNKRAGSYTTKYLRDENGSIIGRELDWVEHVGSPTYRQEQATGKRAGKSAPIERYVTDYGRVPA